MKEMGRGPEVMRGKMGKRCEEKEEVGDEKGLHGGVRSGRWGGRGREMEGEKVRREIIGVGEER